MYMAPKEFSRQSELHTSCMTSEDTKMANVLIKEIKL